MFQLNIKLIENHFLLSNDHNVIYNIDDHENINIDMKILKSTIKYLRKIIDNDKPNSGLYTINNINELLAYMIEYLYHNFRLYKNKFKTQNDFILFIYVNLSLYLTLFSSNSLNMNQFIVDIINIDSLTKIKIDALSEANDTRGLFFYLCNKFDLPYDKLVKKQLVSYVYNAPKINKKWQNKYREDGKPIIFWFYESLLGKSLFFVLYGPKCRYKMEKGGCSGCNLPTVSSSDNAINDLDIRQQIDNTFLNDISYDEKSSIREIILSNNGSILDPKTISQDLLKYAIIQITNYLPNLEKIILETRIDNYTDYTQLKDIYNQIQDLNLNISIELAIGFEIFDDNLRNGYYRKGLEKSILESKISDLSDIDISLKIYLMFKAVPDQLMNLEESIKDINNASEYFSNLSYKYNTKLNLHISPTYLAPGTQLYKDYKNGLYTPLTTDDINTMFEQLKVYDNLSYYISMNDEGLSDDRLLSDNNYDKYMELSKKIHHFNITQNKEN